MSGSALCTLAPAKINLTLEVLGRREDGFHDIASVVQTVDLTDSVELRAAAESLVRIVGDDGRPLPIPFGEELVGRAWQRLRARVDLAGEAELIVTKRIPIAAGLGGGSSDAAAFLRLAQQHWDLAPELVAEVAAEVGADVPLFLQGGTLLLEGRGERVTSIEPPVLDRAWSALLYCPEIPLPAEKTKSMYGALRPTHFGGGARSETLRAALAAGSTPGPEDTSNVFDAVADEVMTGLREARRRVALAAGVVPTLTGAGPSLYLLGEESSLAEAVDGLNAAGGGTALLVRPLAAAQAARVERVAGD